MTRLVSLRTREEERMKEVSMRSLIDDISRSPTDVFEQLFTVDVFRHFKERILEESKRNMTTVVFSMVVLVLLD